MEKTHIIVNSKSFRRFIKDIEGEIPSDEDVEVEIKNGKATCLMFEYYLEHKGEGCFDISEEIIHRLAKVLKQIREQPVKISFDPKSSQIEILCTV